ncbi:MAG: MarR family transcriptional regulator [Chloroflexia bacterium]
MAHAIRIMPDSDEATAIREAERLHDEALEMAVTHLIGTIPRMFRNIKQDVRQAEAIHELKELGEQQVWVLYNLSRGRQLSSELARAFNVTMPTITSAVDTLVRKGYVERQPDVDDRRRIYLQLTEKGAEMSSYAHAQFRSAVSRFLSPLGDGQLRDIVIACKHIAPLLPEGLYDYEGICPVRPAALDEGS